MFVVYKVRFNLKTRNVEIRTCKETVDIQNLQKAADFVRAFVYGFEVDDALALVRLDDLFVDSFEIQVRIYRYLFGVFSDQNFSKLAIKYVQSFESVYE